MPGNVKTPKDEKLWSKAKGIVDKGYKDVKKDSDDYWALVNGIYQRMKGKKAMTLREQAIRLAQTNAALRPLLLPLLKEAQPSLSWQRGHKGEGGVWETGERALFDAPEGEGSQVPPARDRDGLVLAKTAGSDEEAKLTRELQRMVGNRGKVIHARWWGGGEWTVVFNTEYAALYAFWNYRDTKGKTFGKSTNLGGWFLTIR